MENFQFGEFGGMYVPEPVVKALQDLEIAFKDAMNDETFISEYKYYLKDYVGRENPLYFAKNMTEALGGAKVYLKREDLNHTGAHKINNVIGQILLAKRMGKTKVVAETGAGQHGVATATVAAMFGMECIIFQGAEDVKRQELNVFRMELLGAKVHSVKSGTATLKDAVDEAINFWVENVDDYFYVLGSAVGPHPYPVIVREFQKIIGIEAKKQILEKEGRLPDYLIACVGGGSNAIGLFADFLDEQDVKIYGVEASGHGLNTKMHAATLTKGKEGIVHGMKTIVLQDDQGEVLPVYSISAGLDYPGVGPEHAHLFKTGRVRYESITDNESVHAFRFLSETEGIIPAIESSHAIAFAQKLVPTLPNDQIVIINLSGRGDKDVAAIADYIKSDRYRQ
ncbi:tryptophan synthase subunit beta [Haloplasma contractile]|uniref:Tryptophan synthase beta chain n=1 Tax=Haloplasma contractile SSD-17B TaxID=1033810 RepID=U2DRU0_9MOLU|nr:tryptophan synthase subunit beta [Haloplasma contractile]ERJ11287.1 Tryptophan synthase beta chain protein [Haloplasma contractile SSD-17B]